MRNGEGEHKKGKGNLGIPDFAVALGVSAPNHCPSVHLDVAVPSHGKFVRVNLSV